MSVDADMAAKHRRDILGVEGILMGDHREHADDIEVVLGNWQNDIRRE
jgi:hypothetical protein